MEYRVKSGLRDTIGNWLLTRKYATIIELTVIFGVVLAFLGLAGPFATGNQGLQQGIVWVANVILILLVLLGQWFRFGDIRDLGLKKRNRGWKGNLNTFLWSLVVSVIALIAFLLGSMIIINFGGTMEQADLSKYEYLKNNPGMLAVSMLGVYLVSSFGEELVYRGYLMDRLQFITDHVRHKNIISVVFSAVLFGLAHYQWGVMGVVQTTMMGLALSTMYLLLNKRLIILILAHAYLDTLLLFSIYFA
ncbi:MAG TPA: CPBP family intramembrane glutamic endopeptidase [Eudoraea sp.]|nr:CPBP family intramembrane glutamic endopeptidase [Eudoraea sp.]